MARWLDLAPWRGPTINSGDGDGTPLEAEDAVREVRGLVVHIAEGFFEGTISWEHNPDADVSSHFVGARDGRRAQVVDTHDRAWTQSAGNPYWLSIEEEGFTLGHHLHRPGWERLTDEQIEFTAQLFARIHREFGVPLKLAASPSDRGLAYHSLGAEHGVNWGHSDCPGEPIKAQLPAILARAVEIVNGGDDMGWRDQLTLVIDGKPVTNEAQYWLMGGTDVAWKTYWLVQANEAADATRDAATLAAVKALAAAGGVDAAPIVEAIKAEASATRALVEQRHQEEMTAQQRAYAAELAGLRAELDARAGAGS